jgi:hypothetical protein
MSWLRISYHNKSKIKLKSCDLTRISSTTNKYTRKHTSNPQDVSAICKQRCVIVTRNYFNKIIGQTNNYLFCLLFYLSDRCGESLAYERRRQSVHCSFIKDIICFEHVRYYDCTSSPINLTKVLHTYYIDNPVIR